MLTVGLTGGIASGKSTVAQLFEELGCHVVDSDRITHELLEPGQSVYDAVVEEFGSGIVKADGSIDRRALGSIVFGNPELRRVLNSLVHPGVAERQQSFLDEVAARAADAIGIVDAALMIETGSYKNYDRIIVVSCSVGQQHERLKARGLSDEDIEARIASQMPLAEKLQYADSVIDNSGMLDETRRQVERVWNELRELLN